jgi:transcriptional regulator with XRE-family HTH domain
MSAAPDRLWWCQHCYRQIDRHGLYCSDACEVEENRQHGRRLELARRTLGLTPAEMAARLEMSPRAYRAWELGHRREYSALWSVAVYRHKVPIRIEWLLGGSQPMIYPDAELERILAHRRRLQLAA